jgi:hypothetical protein
VESDDQEKIKYQAEGKLVSFCEQILKGGVGVLEHGSSISRSV